MLLIVLLLAALACLVFGIVFASAWWLAGSIALSVVAGVVLWRGRADRPAATSPPAAMPTDQTAEDEVDPALARRRADALEAADGTAQVWVIDGRPRYHEQGCAQLDGEDAEQVPFEQAVEDGFVACPDCSVSVESTDVASGPAEPEPVAQPAESASVPVVDAAPAQANEPAPQGQPESQEQATSATRPASASSAGEVWVVVGRPRFHTRECAIIDGQSAAAMSRADAAAAGLRPCSLCEP